MQKLLQQHREGAFGLAWKGEVRQSWDLQVVVSILANFINSYVWITYDYMENSIKDNVNILSCSENKNIL